MKTALRTAASAVALLALASAANAADLPAYEAAPLVAVPSFTWTGFYVGATAGYVFTDPKTRTRGNPGTANPSPEQNNVANRLRPPSEKLGGDGFTVGATVGYNFQLDNSPLVIGVEADLSYTDIDDKKTYNIINPANVGVGNIRSVTKQELDYLGTVRGRIGYAFDRVLVFGTGGLAFGKVKASGDFYNAVNAGANPGALGFAGSKSKTEYGYVVGGGVEYAVTDNITVKGEYLYYDLGKSSYTVASTPLAPSPNGYTSKIKTDGQIVRAGINYKF